MEPVVLPVGVATTGGAVVVVTTDGGNVDTVSGVVVEVVSGTVVVLAGAVVVDVDGGAAVLVVDGAVVVDVVVGAVVVDVVDGTVEVVVDVVDGAVVVVDVVDGAVVVDVVAGTVVVVVVVVVGGGVWAWYSSSWVTGVPEDAPLPATVATSAWVAPAAMADSFAVQPKEAPTANGPAHVVPVEPSGNVQSSPDTLAVPCVTLSVTVMAESGSLPSLVIVNTRSVLVPAGTVTDEALVLASLPAASSFTTVTDGTGGEVAL
jgi:hypothetical protein